MTCWSAFDDVHALKEYDDPVVHLCLDHSAQQTEERSEELYLEEETWW